MRFSPHLNEESIIALMRNGLKARHPNAVKTWESSTNEFTQQLRDEMNTRVINFRKRLGDDSPRLLLALESFIVDNILLIFP